MDASNGHIPTGAIQVIFIIINCISIIIFNINDHSNGHIPTGAIQVIMYSSYNDIVVMLLWR